MGLSHGVVAHWMEILKPTPKNRRQMLHASRAITASFCRSFQAGAVRNRFLGDTSAPVVRNQSKGTRIGRELRRLSQVLLFWDTF